ncbi:MAG TPA: hypothetical protein VMU17_07090, partial [Elusimicrobiota bacterium]|nr:hypothetical protein [Elusimicrobiota bacterium]
WSGESPIILNSLEWDERKGWILRATPHAAVVHDDAAPGAITLYALGFGSLTAEKAAPRRAPDKASPIRSMGKTRGAALDAGTQTGLWIHADGVGAAVTAAMREIHLKIYGRFGPADARRAWTAVEMLQPFLAVALQELRRRGVELAVASPWAVHLVPGSADDIGFLNVHSPRALALSRDFVLSLLRAVEAGENSVDDIVNTLAFVLQHELRHSDMPRRPARLWSRGTHDFDVGDERKRILDDMAWEQGSPLPDRALRLAGLKGLRAYVERLRGLVVMEPAERNADIRDMAEASVRAPGQIRLISIFRNSKKPVTGSHRMQVAA